ncbi:CAP domain-containing protein [Stutzerimonas azotifigens]|uniref:CAP domain-containing protein n=1 Tax=Stutzerimonas azotifigens TaxID=291995 RepID=A0ABR5Z1X4_9GAMM|nr:CAP domain-containing protein [Stutzerimonas azotifigens]MBA1274213.1 CAP domain-containing protein [Stutzerimonas azotifigens]
MPTSIFHPVACLLGVGLLIGSAGVHADDADVLVSLINDYRSSAQTCNGASVEAAGPLAPDERLAGLQVSSGAQTQADLQRAGYRAASLQAIAVSGPKNAEAAMMAIGSRYCSALTDARFAEVGVSRRGDTWQVVLARPQLSSDLGDWQAAGRELLAQVNGARAASRRCGKRTFDAAPELTWNAVLATTARGHSEDMAKQNYFGHQDLDGGNVGTRASAQGYRWGRIGENIAAGQGSVKQAMAGWLASPGHCANIMNPDFTELGAAFAIDPRSDAGIYWTQVFGKPR